MYWWEVLSLQFHFAFRHPFIIHITFEVSQFLLVVTFCTNIFFHINQNCLLHCKRTSNAVRFGPIYYLIEGSEHLTLFYAHPVVFFISLLSDDIMQKFAEFLLWKLNFLFMYARKERSAFWIILYLTFWTYFQSLDSMVDREPDSGSDDWVFEAWCSHISACTLMTSNVVESSSCLTYYFIGYLKRFGFVHWFGILITGPL